MLRLVNHRILTSIRNYPNVSSIAFSGIPRISTTSFATSRKKVNSRNQRISDIPYWKTDDGVQFKPLHMQSFYNNKNLPKELQGKLYAISYFDDAVSRESYNGSRLNVYKVYTADQIPKKYSSLYYVHEVYLPSNDPNLIAYRSINPGEWYVTNCAFGNVYPMSHFSSLVELNINVTREILYDCVKTALNYDSIEPLIGFHPESKLLKCTKQDITRIFEYGIGQACLLGKLNVLDWFAYKSGVPFEYTKLDFEYAVSNNKVSVLRWFLIMSTKIGRMGNHRYNHEFLIMLFHYSNKLALMIV
jgi:hypothetical protein